MSRALQLHELTGSVFLCGMYRRTLHSLAKVLSATPSQADNCTYLGSSDTIRHTLIVANLVTYGSFSSDK